MRKILFAILFLGLFAPAIADDVCPAGFTPEEHTTLPVGYTALEYIMATDLTTTYIDTKILYSNSAKAVIQVEEINYGSWGTIFISGGRSTPYFGFYNPGVRTDSASFGLISPNYTKTENTMTFTWTGVKEYDSNVCIFGWTSNDWSVEEKLKLFKLYDSSDVLLFNGIPAKRINDSAIGLFDTVTQTFFTNAYSGTFTAGPEKKYNTINLDNADCFACPYNTYKPNAGNEACTPCPDGSFSPVGSTSLSDCAKILHIGEYVVYMPMGRRTEHGLCTMFNGVKYCADVYERQ